MPRLPSPRFVASHRPLQGPAKGRRGKRERSALPQPLRIKPGAPFNEAALDADAVKVVRRLLEFGFEAYFVGGCVRDMLLGLTPKDFDIATSATPRQVKRLFRNSRVIGRRFRLVHVVFGAHILEVSTFRALARPRPAGTDPMIREDNDWGTAVEDALRRDFTANGLFYDIAKGEVIDYVSGLRDLDRRRIETIGDPWVRFREDPVRMLRATKFAGRLGLHLADDVYQAMVDCAEDIRKTAGPRVHEEILRLTERGGATLAVSLLEKTGLLAVMLPEVEASLRAEWEQGITPATWGRFAALDRRARAGEAIPPVVRFAVLLGTLVEALCCDASLELTPSQAMNLVEDGLAPSLQRLHMARRDVWKLKQIYFAQRRLMVSPSVRRKPPLNAFMHREYYREALLYMQLTSEATGRFVAEIEAWSQAR